MHPQQFFYIGIVINFYSYFLIIRQAYYYRYQMSRILLSVLLTLIIIVPISQGQRGGGRSSGGGGGRSSFGGGSSFRGGYYNGGNYYGRRTTSCYESCMGNPTCIQNCQQQSGSGPAGIIVGSIFGSCCLCGLATFLCISCKNKGLCKNCCYSEYNKIKKHFNNIEPGMMSQQQYISKRNRIVHLINQSKNLNTFSFQQAGEYASINASAEIKMRIEGHDKYGGWKADGYIFPRGGQIFMWLYKEYDDKDYAQQTDEWQHLIYQSTGYDDAQGLKGKWYYWGFENSNQYIGDWRLFGEGNGNNTNTNTTGQIINYPPIH